MTAASDDCADDLRAGADARVRPDDRVLDSRLLFDVDALAENGVYDLRAGLDGAVVGDDGEVVNLGVSRRVERAAPVFQFDSADATRKIFPLGKACSLYSTARPALD